MKQFTRKTKLMLVLPLLIVPFGTLAFWALGGGKGEATAGNEELKGLNLHLPAAILKDDKVMDKLAFYDKASSDSLKLDEYLRSDPYYKKNDSVPAPPVNELEQLTEISASKFNQRLNTSPYEEGHESPDKKVMERLAMLEKELGKTNYVQEERRDAIPVHNDRVPDDHAFSSQVDRLESMLGMMTKNGEADPEMKQLDGTLDKILDIQDPSRIKERLKEKSLQNKEIVFAVCKQALLRPASLLGGALGDRYDQEPGFFGPDDDAVPDSTAADVSIEAVVHENQSLVNGAVIKLRLVHDIYINGSLVPGGNFVFAIASLHDERLEAEVNSIRCKQTLFPVKLEMYDMDGLPGIYIPGAITRDVAKQSADNSLQLMEPGLAGASLPGQAAVAGAGAVKSLLGKRTKMIRVLVKAGYKVLLKNGSTINN